MAKQAKNKKSESLTTQNNSQLPVEKQEHTGFRGMSRSNIKKLAIFTVSTIVAAIVGFFPPTLIITTLLLAVAAATLAYHMAFKNIFHGIKQTTIPSDDQYNKIEVETIKLPGEEKNTHENLQTVRKETKDNYQRDDLKISDFKKDVLNEVKAEEIENTRKEDSLNSSDVKLKSVIKQILQHGPDLITEKQLVNLQKELKTKLQKENKEICDKKSTSFQELASRKNTDNTRTR